MPFAIFFGNFLQIFENSPASGGGGCLPVVPLRSRPPKLFPSKTKSRRRQCKNNRMYVVAISIDHTMFDFLSSIDHMLIYNKSCFSRYLVGADCEQMPFRIHIHMTYSFTYMLFHSESSSDCDSGLWRRASTHDIHILLHHWGEEKFRATSF